MKSADIVPLTTVYAHKAWANSSGGRAVVLSTAIWAPVYARSTHGRDRFQKAEPGTKGSGRHNGMLVLHAWHITAGQVRIKNADLIALAAPALAAIEAGTTPNLPDGVYVGLSPARHIVSTWEDFRAARQQAEELREAHQAAMAAQGAADRQARQRVTAIVGAENLGMVAGLMPGRPGAWSDLERLLETYALERSSDLAAF